MTADNSLDISLFMTFHRVINSSGGVTVDAIASIAVNGGFEHWSCHTKGYNICMYCFAAHHAAPVSKIKEWLAQIFNNLSERGDMSTPWTVA